MNAKSFLIDLDGVLYVNKKPLDGAKESISFLEDNGYHYRFVSNTTTKSRSTLACSILGDNGIFCSRRVHFHPCHRGG